jgi:hypothetical protein
MTSLQKIRANQENSGHSTGPRTQAGKAKSARNSFRHGLSIPIADCFSPTEIEAWACRIAGEGASPQLRELAARIAEAQIDYTRVRQARQSLIDRAVTVPAGPAAGAPPDIGEGEEGRGPQGAERALALVRIAADLRAIDRYERRALSRRRSAIRAFEAVRAVTTCKALSVGPDRCGCSPAEQTQAQAQVASAAAPAQKLEERASR